ncbi:MAG: hypothetical protein H6667_09540 [Ardenticatenaceae bacterium]|nr:hypothetical protein [Ardenticatenaceae bacterium]MCB9443464.1 hypothetical protein [Ardenticatenaceae bacterium]
MRNYPLTRYTWLLLLASMLIGCQPSLEPAVSAEEPTPSPEPTISVQAEYWTAWESSPHANTYALEKGPNTYCARCHSPQNWDMVAKVDPPPNCVSCKFPNEPEPRIAQDNPLVPEEEWQDIGCAICHRMENGVADSEIAWLDISTNYYETVASSTELCGKCHADTETLRHSREIGSAHPDFTCTDCHDAHTTTASCTTGGCHADITARFPVFIPEHSDQVNNEECTNCHSSVADIHMNILDETPVACMDCHKLLMGGFAQVRYQAAHSNLHATVTCVACHDGSGLEVGLLPNQDQWVTFRTTSLLGRDTTAPYQSHDMQREVDCARCHYPDNPWGLTTDIEELPSVDNAG